MPSYESITLPQMGTLLDGLGLSLLTLDGVNEAVYACPLRLYYGPDDVPLENRPYIAMSLRVYTSVVVNRSRSVGEDAIRIVLLYRALKTGKVLPVHLENVPRVNRTPGWQVRVAERVELLRSMKHLPACPTCGAPMTAIRPRAGQKFDPFLSCILFQTGVCNGTLKLDVDKRS